MLVRITFFIWGTLVFWKFFIANLIKLMEIVRRNEMLRAIISSDQIIYGIVYRRNGKQCISTFPNNKFHCEPQ